MAKLSSWAFRQSGHFRQISLRIKSQGERDGKFEAGMTEMPWFSVI
jgi:hypothetical protein